MNDVVTELRAVGIVLAAGASRRLGRPKQLVRHGGQPLLRGVARQVGASTCVETAVVVPPDRPDIEACLEGLPLTVLPNAQAEEGMAASIRRGIAWATSRPCDGAVIVACDQIALRAPHVDRLLARWRQGEEAVVASRYAGILGVPAVFARSRFAELLSLRGERGARSILLAEGAPFVDWPEGAIDLDTPADLRFVDAGDAGELGRG